MKEQEFVDKVGKILGIKPGLVKRAHIWMVQSNNLHQRIELHILPSKYQAKKLRDLAFEFSNVQPKT